MNGGHGVQEPTRGTDVISVRNVSKTFAGGAGRVEALRGIDMSLRPGEFVSIIGPSGCGKSTLLRIIGGLLEPTSGSVHIREESVVQAQANKEIGFVFQQPALMPWRNVEENVRLPLQINRSANRNGQASSSEMLELVGLSEFAEAYPYQLSGGMQQRVSIARALIFDPAVLLMDEPFGALDEITRGEMRFELLRIWQQSKKTVLFVTHSISEALILADRVLLFTPRPGQTQETLEIDIPRPRTEDVEGSAVFNEYADHLRKMLRSSTSGGDTATEPVGSDR